MPATLALAIVARHRRSARRGPAWPGRDQGQRQRRRGVCDRAARTLSARVLELELEQARYEARLACRRYESVDPDNCLVSSELEARWNATLSRVRELEGRLDVVRAGSEQDGFKMLQRSLSAQNP